MLAIELPPPANKTSRLEARVTEEQKALLQRAATLAGQSLSEFIVNSAREAAIRTITDFELIRLTADERDAFVAVLLNPPAPGARLAQAAKNFKKNREA
jgi:uncharacterized protein (DUF1778 family)